MPSSKNNVRVAEPVVEPPVAEPPVVEPVAEPVAPVEFAELFAALSMTMPPSIRKGVALKLFRRGIDVSIEPVDDAQKLCIQNALENAQEKYCKKRERARLAAAARAKPEKAATPPPVAEEPAI